MAIRAVCYKCFRPQEFCYCGLIPAINNKTEILILQHQRERSHPFNTARMADQALSRSAIIVGSNEQLAKNDLGFAPDAALLYPGPSASLLSDLPPHRRPGQLVILDGTWHQAKTLLRDIPAVQSMPRYGLAPAHPGRYRIRLEPNDTALSTVEAIVAALRALEPDTPGLDRLLEAFNVMVERQLAHPQSRYGSQPPAQRRQSRPNIPYSLIHDFDNMIVAYGESAGGERHTSHSAGIKPRRIPIFWVAHRLSTGETFQAAIDPGTTCLTQTQLDHLDLDRSEFENSVSLDRFRQQWRDFVRRGETLVVYNQSTISLLENVGIDVGSALVLKSITLGSQKKNGALHHALQMNGLCEQTSKLPGRAGKRLAGAIALTRLMHERGSRQKQAGIIRV